MTDVSAQRIAAEHEREQNRVESLYNRLDQLRSEKQKQLARVRHEGPQGSVQNISERDAFAALYEDRLSQLDAVEDRLVFGSLAFRDQTPERYIGRIGLRSEGGEQVLVDWRAPEAGTFYQATAFDPQGVARRRHLMLRGRSLHGIEDDILDPDFEGTRVGNESNAALMSALNARRTGRMNDIVSTIQAEQDSIIRRPLSGVSVVQGGPGTGKTAVALHRAAYLLYSQRERLARSGVLLVGPSRAFLEYIEQVLPSLGETGVVMKTVGQLYPGVDARGQDSSLAAEVKGRPVWLEILQRAVRQRQRTFASARRVDVDGFSVTITPEMVKVAQDAARATRKPHNEARETFASHLMNAVTVKITDQMKQESAANTADRSYVADDVAASRDVRVAVNLAWMPLTPETVLGDLLSRPELLVDAAPELSSKEIVALIRRDAEVWSESDVPLLDELADLLGPLDAQSASRIKKQAEQDERDLDNAQRALENVATQLENFGVDGVISAEDITRSLAGPKGRVSVGQAADSDRTWAYGHVVVDEAQELTFMQWHTIFKRVPLRSMTLVGDINQASAPGSASSWAEALAPWIGQRFDELPLTINYRTPQRICDAAIAVAHAAGVEIEPAEAVREGKAPTVEVVEGDAWKQSLVEAVARMAEELDGLVAAIVPEAALNASREALAQFSRVLVVDPREAKGLEFDGVVLLDPSMILAEGQGRVGPIYVAMTRPTQRLHVVGVESLPAGLEDFLQP